MVYSLLFCLQSALSKERRELQMQQQRTLLEAIPRDLSRPWEDPMPEEGERHLAMELRGIGKWGMLVPGKDGRGVRWCESLV